MKGEKRFKSWLKRKVRITQSLLVGLMIVGGLAGLNTVSNAAFIDTIKIGSSVPVRLGGETTAKEFRILDIDRETKTILLSNGERRNYNEYGVIGGSAGLRVRYSTLFTSMTPAGDRGLGANYRGTFKEAPASNTYANKIVNDYKDLYDAGKVTREEYNALMASRVDKTGKKYRTEIAGKQAFTSMAPAGDRGFGANYRGTFDEAPASNTYANKIVNDYKDLYDAGKVTREEYNALMASRVDKTGKKYRTEITGKQLFTGMAPAGDRGFGANYRGTFDEAPASNTYANKIVNDYKDLYDAGKVTREEYNALMASRVDKTGKKYRTEITGKQLFTGMAPAGDRGFGANYRGTFEEAPGSNTYANKIVNDYKDLYAAGKVTREEYNALMASRVDKTGKKYRTEITGKQLFTGMAPAGDRGFGANYRGTFDEAPASNTYANKIVNDYKDLYDAGKVTREEYNALMASRVDKTGKKYRTEITGKQLFTGMAPAGDRGFGANYRGTFEEAPGSNTYANAIVNDYKDLYAAGKVTREEYNALMASRVDKTGKKYRTEITGKQLFTGMAPAGDRGFGANYRGTFDEAPASNTYANKIVNDYKDLYDAGKVTREEYNALMASRVDKTGKKYRTEITGKQLFTGMAPAGDRGFGANYRGTFKEAPASNTYANKIVNDYKDLYDAGKVTREEYDALMASRVDKTGKKYRTEIAGKQAFTSMTPAGDRGFGANYRGTFEEAPASNTYANAIVNDYKDLYDAGKVTREEYNALMASRVDKTGKKYRTEIAGKQAFTSMTPAGDRGFGANYRGTFDEAPASNTYANKIVNDYKDLYAAGKVTREEYNALMASRVDKTGKKYRTEITGKQAFTSMTPAGDRGLGANYRGTFEEAPASNTYANKIVNDYKDLYAAGKVTREEYNALMASRVDKTGKKYRTEIAGKQAFTSMTPAGDRGFGANYRGTFEEAPGSNTYANKIVNDYKDLYDAGKVTREEYNALMASRVDKTGKKYRTEITGKQLFTGMAPAGDRGFGANYRGTFEEAPGSNTYANKIVNDYKDLYAAGKVTREEYNALMASRVDKTGKKYRTEIAGKQAFTSMTPAGDRGFGANYRGTFEEAPGSNTYANAIVNDYKDLYAAGKVTREEYNALMASRVDKTGKKYRTEIAGKQAFTSMTPAGDRGLGANYRGTFEEAPASNTYANKIVNDYKDLYAAGKVTREEYNALMASRVDKTGKKYRTEIAGKQAFTSMTPAGDRGFGANYRGTFEEAPGSNTYANAIVNDYKDLYDAGKVTREEYNALMASRVDKTGKKYRTEIAGKQAFTSMTPAGDRGFGANYRGTFEEAPGSNTYANAIVNDYKDLYDAGKVTREEYNALMASRVDKTGKKYRTEITGKQLFTGMAPAGDRGFGANYRGTFEEAPGSNTYANAIVNDYKDLYDAGKVTREEYNALMASRVDKTGKKYRTEIAGKQAFTSMTPAGDRGFGANYRGTFEEAPGSNTYANAIVNDYKDLYAAGKVTREEYNALMASRVDKTGKKYRTEITGKQLFTGMAPATQCPTTCELEKKISTNAEGVQLNQEHLAVVDDKNAVQDKELALGKEMDTNQNNALTSLHGRVLTNTAKNESQDTAIDENTNGMKTNTEGVASNTAKINEVGAAATKYIHENSVGISANAEGVQLNQEHLAVVDDKNAVQDEELALGKEMDTNQNNALTSLHGRVLTNTAKNESQDTAIDENTNRIATNTEDIAKIGHDADAMASIKSFDEPQNRETGEFAAPPVPKTIQDGLTTIDGNTKLNRDAIIQTQADVAHNARVLEENRSVIDHNSKRIDGLESESRKGISGVAAISAIKFQPMTTGEAQIGVGYGNFKGNSAIALGVGAQVSDNIMVNMAVSGTAGSETETVYSAGATYKFNLFNK